MYPLSKIMGAALFCLVVIPAGLFAALGQVEYFRAGLVLFTVVVALASRFDVRWRGYQFTAWIIAAVTAAMIYPHRFLMVDGYDLRNKWLILTIVQLVMFGMGTQMSLKDFAGVARAPRGVLVGIICHFSVMPLVGWGLTKIFHFEPEIAAGVILIGSCSSGLASNVMAFIARSNLALSVTVTAITTMIAPLMTPLWMKLLAGTLVEVKFLPMMLEIVKIVLVPVGAALLHDYLKQAPAAQRKYIWGLAGIVAVWLVFLMTGGWQVIRGRLSDTTMSLMVTGGFLLSIFLIGSIYHQLTRAIKSLDRLMPVFSMFGIVYFTTLGMLSIARGLTMLWTGGFPLTDLGPQFGFIGAGFWLGIPMAVWISAILVAAFFVLTRHTTLGRYIYAVGGSEKAAAYSGINVNRIKLWVYALGGGLAAVAGLVVTARLDAADPKAGLGYELDSIAAVVIGGTSLSGGRGSVLGTVLGCLIIGVLNNGLFLLDVSPFWQQVIKGFVILAAVAADKIGTKKEI